MTHSVGTDNTIHTDYRCTVMTFIIVPMWLCMTYIM